MVACRLFLRCTWQLLGTLYDHNRCFCMQNLLFFGVLSIVRRRIVSVTIAISLSPSTQLKAIRPVQRNKIITINMMMGHWHDINVS
jgi:hypothetical protein